MRIGQILKSKGEIFIRAACLEEDRDGGLVRSRFDHEILAKMMVEEKAALKWSSNHLSGIFEKLKFKNTFGLV